MRGDVSARRLDVGMPGAVDQARIEALARAEYERVHPEDTFDDLKRRARFDKGNKGLLAHWLSVAERRLTRG